VLLIELKSVRSITKPVAFLPDACMKIPERRGA
jgi:hypothetical protein